MTRLVEEARSLLTALTPLVRPEVATTLRDAQARLDEPLRVAIAGRVKAGKSTLLNAVIGQAAAATDAAECTRAVTWYVDGTAYLAWARDRDGGRRQVPYRRTSTAAVVDLDREDLDAIERVEVEFPSPHLRAMTLIDTPGIASVSEQVSARASDFLLPGHGDQGADVVVYLLRYVHERDTDFLEAFTDPAVAAVGPVRSVAVLSRADEIGNGRGDALLLAHRVAHRYAAHPTLRAQVADVLPVAGLLAFTAATLTETEFGHLRALVGLSQVELERLLVSVDRFVAPSDRAPVGEEARAALLRRFGLFGVRLATWLIASGTAASAGALAQALEVHSGIHPLRRLLLDRFAGRADVLKAARAIDLVDAVVEEERLGDAGFERELERVIAGSHELAELRCLAEASILGEDEIHLGAGTRERAFAALGVDGPEPWHRLGVDPATDPAEMLAVARQRVNEFRTATLGAFVDRTTEEILNVATRSIEAVHHGLAGRVPEADDPA